VKTLILEQTIPGLDLAVATMREGEKALITVKPDQGYGPQGNPQVRLH
jgi:FKBP-type peptidyl-prolyl cis-trans isomerase